MMCEGQHYRHLGVPTGFKTKQTPSETIVELVADYIAIDSSELAPWQKIDAAVTFLNPKLDFILRAAKVAMAPLVADNQVKKIVKKWLDLPHRASAELVYLLPSQGGAGILPLRDQHNILAVVHGFRLLTCPDRTVSTTAWYSLRKTVAIRLGGRQRPTLEQLVDYLNGIGEVRNGGDIATIWCRVRQATWELKKYNRYRRDPEKPEPELNKHVNNEGSQPEIQILIPRPGEPEISRVNPAVRKQVCHALRDYVRFSYLKRLLCTGPGEGDGGSANVERIQSLPQD